ncbi:MAG: SAM-dependent methyltransferase [Candidatus Hydrogenedentes bacterium]|nr:SAM-dependent methyltransferase [Candidatus Hydrogenedentota bacterium]
MSGVGIAYELALMRIFSIAQWHHFAYMVISIAMLGFGASGTALALLRSRLLIRATSCLRLLVFLASVSLVICYAAAQYVPFETYQLVSQPNQMWYLLALYVIFAVPFFLIASTIALAFMVCPEHVGRIYFFNMLGSGIGAAFTVAALYFVHPATLPYLLMLPAAAALLLLSVGNRTSLLVGVIPLILIIIACGTFGTVPIRISEYKGLSYARQWPDAKIIAERYSPLSVVTALKSSQLRETPGQIANYPMAQLGPLPEQIGLYFDAGAVSPINRFDGNLQRVAYLDYVTSAVAYRLVNQPRVCILGAGGGTDVLNALYHGAQHVTAVDVDPGVFALVRQTCRDFSGQLYERADVTPVLAEGRGFLQSRNPSDARYDLIQIPLSGSYSAAAAGVYALDEGYVYTVEAFSLYLNRLSKDGVLAVTCWLNSPPREAIKLLATAIEACHRYGIRDPSRHVVFIRAWNNATLIVSHRPLDEAAIVRVREFCTDRGLDLAYLPGIQAEESNRYTVLERDLYFEAAQALLGGSQDDFYTDYLFHVRPATDDSPYFFQFFRWSALPYLLRGMGAEWIPFVEWGYVTLVATLAQGLVGSVLLILLPLLLFARAEETRSAIPWTLVYFASLGCAYMLLELAFIQKFILYLAYPVYAVAVVLTAFLIFSGLGSLFSERYRSSPVKPVGSAILAISLTSPVLVLILTQGYAFGATWSDLVKVLLSVLLLSPLAFAMGIPFPVGLQHLSTTKPSMLPWAWGVNGCASVLGAPLATLFAMHLGFRGVILTALVLYLIAFGAFTRLRART